MTSSGEQLQVQYLAEGGWVGGGGCTSEECLFRNGHPVGCPLSTRKYFEM